MRRPVVQVRGSFPEFTQPVFTMKRLALTLTAGLAVLLTACKAYKEVTGDPEPTNKAYDIDAVTPPEFLLTRSAPLNKWLDTPVRVQIYEVPLLEVFRHPALRGLEYTIINKPQDNPKITIDKIAMTRRQLLWSLSHDHQLHMSPAYSANGNVSHIEIRARVSELQKLEAMN
jgi:hypothetical protein